MTNAAPNNVLEYQLFTLIKLNFCQNYAIGQFTHTPPITIRITITITITTIVIEVGNKQSGPFWSLGRVIGLSQLHSFATPF